MSMRLNHKKNYDQKGIINADRKRKMFKSFETCLKHVFCPKNVFFHPNLRTLNMYALASFQFGFRRSNISKNDKNILCIRQNHVLVEFFQTIKCMWIVEYKCSQFLLHWWVAGGKSPIGILNKVGPFQEILKIVTNLFSFDRSCQKTITLLVSYKR